MTMLYHVFGIVRRTVSERDKETVWRQLKIDTWGQPCWRPSQAHLHDCL